MNPTFSEDDRLKINRSHHEKQMWTRFGMVVLGLWLLASPETFGYVHEPSRWSDWIGGGLLIFFGLFSMSYRYRWWIWGGCAVGIWLQFAPLGFWAKEPVIYVNDTLIGVLAIGFCVLVPFRPREFDLGPEIPPGWSYNPSSWLQRIPVVFFAVISWFIARYLASYQLHYIHEVLGSGAEKVITSMISKNFPVSDAGMGALAYSLEALMGAKGGSRRWHTMPWIVLTFGVLVVPLGLISIVLVMLQPLVVGAWCGLCLVIAFCLLVMLTLTVDEVVATCQFLKQTKQPFWQVLFHGSNYTEVGVDNRTPSFHASPWKIIHAMLWGVTVRWNLIITALIGLWLMFSDGVVGLSGILAKNSNVMGALIFAISIISRAEVIRSARFLNILLAIWFAIAPWVLAGGRGFDMWYSGILAAVVIVLSIFRGRIKENYGTWDRCIF